MSFYIKKWMCVVFNHNTRFKNENNENTNFIENFGYLLKVDF